MRQLAAVLTRRIAMYVLDQSEGDESVSKSLLNAVKEKLLVLVESETNKVIRKKLCDAISEWARYSQGELSDKVYVQCVQLTFVCLHVFTHLFVFMF